MDRKIPVKDGKQSRQAKKAKAQIEADSDEELREKQRLRHQWAPCEIHYVKCDSCEELAADQVAHQMCAVCAIAICHDCVAAGNMKLYPTHPQRSIGELDWKPRSITSASHGAAQVSNSAPGTGSGGRCNPASATPVLRRPASLAGSSSTGSNKHNLKSSSFRNGKNKATAGLGSCDGPKQIQTVLTRNQNSSLNLSTPTKKPKKPSKKKIILSESDSDLEYEMDAHSTNSPDNEYIPRADLSRKASASSKKSVNETESVGTPASNTPVAAIGLANSRPVRAATIQTYEKMRQANVKKQRDAEEPNAALGEDQNAKSGLKMADSAQSLHLIPQLPSAKNLPRGAKTNGHAQQGTVEGANAYLHAPEHAQQAAGYDFKNHTQVYQHKGLPQLHPGAGFRAQTKATESLAPAVASDDEKRAAAAAAEETPAPKRQNTSSQYFAPISKAELSATSSKAIKKAEASTREAAPKTTLAEHDASRAFVTAGLDDLAAAIEHKVRLRLSLTGVRNTQDAEIELRNAVHGAWVSNMALTRIKRADGNLAAMQLLRGYANLVMMKLQMNGTGLLKNWIDATEKEMQDSAPFVPNELRIQTVEPAAQQGLTFKIGETDVFMANILAGMKNSSR
ncbi:uncharacterized protein ColSpa_08476 [Colletotrichum spaethianum]|uniref:Uncharacterized protein n=1 Tax=Colletotrichum spaethianum TaxID=700344 RepID=A0AA37P9W3_9PEZI|nr:uncharacterized protein ColSpa_08476 [Colletotrichum spaethianum]GKT48295.1 hypothetical protein ColSpa_08476 [Colletotrichum spaethianum]